MRHQHGSESGRRAKALVTAVSMAVLSVLLLGWYASDMMKCFSAARWPETEGRITECSVETSGKKGRNYELRARYAYVVDGVTYEGKRLRPTDDRYWFRSSALSDQQKHPVGSSCRVKYSASRPDLSCLQATPGMSTVLKVGVGLILAMGAWFTFRGDRPAQVPLPAERVA